MRAITQIELRCSKRMLIQFLVVPLSTPKRRPYDFEIETGLSFNGNAKTRPLDADTNDASGGQWIGSFLHGA